MNNGTLYLLVVAIVVFATLWPVRRAFARRNSGPLAQREFRRDHGADLARLLGGRLDPLPKSPWIEFELDGRDVRLVAARLHGGRFQAGIQLVDREFPAQITFTNGDRDEIHPRDGVTHEQLLPIVARLRAELVDSVASPKFGWESPPVLRVQFDDVNDLPGRLERIAPILRDLEALRPPGDAFTSP